jgi:hypothetical protein
VLVRDAINEEMTAYELEWNSRRSDPIIEITGIPSLNYAIYLTNTVKFHEGQPFHLFEESEYMRHLHEIYGQSHRKT